VASCLQQVSASGRLCVSSDADISTVATNLAVYGSATSLAVYGYSD
jgi:hypothetical protein